jgi:hypothetical protein
VIVCEPLGDFKKGMRLLDISFTTTKQNLKLSDLNRTEFEQDGKGSFSNVCDCGILGS